MSNEEKNITIIDEDDKDFIREITCLSPEKKILVKGILIGLELKIKDTTVRKGK